MTLITAVTGGIGAGKSSAAARLAERGAVVIDSDRLAREVVAPGTPGLAAVVASFGPGVLSPSGELDRAALAAVVFADPDARRHLEAITHPRVRARFAELVAAAPRDAIVVNDIPLLVDLPTAASFHLVIGVHAAASTRVSRLVGRGLTEADARARIAAQISDEERRALCDVWLSNDGGPDKLATAIDRLWKNRLVPFRNNLLAGRATRSTTDAPDRNEELLLARVSRAVGERAVMVASERQIEVIAPDKKTAIACIGALPGAGFPFRPRPGRYAHADPGSPTEVVVVVA